MAKAKKATAQQVFRQYLKLSKAKEAVNAEARKLRELAKTNQYISELVEHNGSVFRVTTSDRSYMNEPVNVEKIAAVSDLERVIK